MNENSKKKIFRFIKYTIMLVVLFLVIQPLLAYHIYRAVEPYDHTIRWQYRDEDIKLYKDTFEKLDYILSPRAVEMQKELIQDLYVYANKYDKYFEVCKSIGPYMDHDFVKETYYLLRREGDRYTTYQNMMSYLHESRDILTFEDALDALSEFPDDYRDIPSLKQYYEEIKDCPFMGTYRSNFSNDHYQELHIGYDICDYQDYYNTAYEFKIYAKVTWYDKGKKWMSVYTYFYPKNIGENKIRSSLGDWTIADDNTLTVHNVNETTTFYDKDYPDKKNAGAKNQYTPKLGFFRRNVPKAQPSVIDKPVFFSSVPGINMKMSNKSYSKWKPTYKSSYSSPKSTYTSPKSQHRNNPYDVYDYDDPDDFADEWEDEFDSWDDALMYWEDHH